LGWGSGSVSGFGVVNKFVSNSESGELVIDCIGNSGINGKFVNKCGISEFVSECGINESFIFSSNKEVFLSNIGDGCISDEFLFLCNKCVSIFTFSISEGKRISCGGDNSSGTSCNVLWLLDSGVGYNILLGSGSVVSNNVLWLLNSGSVVSGNVLWLLGGIVLWNNNNDRVGGNSIVSVVIWSVVSIVVIVVSVSFTTVWEDWSVWYVNSSVRSVRSVSICISISISVCNYIYVLVWV
jgi:hypothetical protein